MNRVFEIDFKKLIVLLLPTFLRKPVLFSLLKALIRPVVILYDDFKTQRTKNLYRANHNGQVCYLRKMLNDYFDNDLRRMSIAEGNADDWTFIYKHETFNETEGGVPLWMSRADSAIPGSYGNSTLVFDSDNIGIKLISKQGYVGSSGLDFLIRVPASLRGIADESRMISLVNYYKLASKRYTITYY